MAWRSIKRVIVPVMAIAILTAAVEILYLNVDPHVIQNKREMATSDYDASLSAKPHQRVFSTVKFDAATGFSTAISDSSTDSGNFVTSLPNATTRNVFYNRLAKCGSRSLLTLVHSVTKSNGIKRSMSSNFWDDHPNDALAFKEMRKIARLKPPTFYNRHIHYLDFQKHGFHPPVYINMIRDPISRFQSIFNYAKYGDSYGKVRNPPKNLSDINKCVMNDEEFCNSSRLTHYYTNYFCGFDPVCNNTRSIEQVELAKRHIRDNYLVIGLTEEFENTLSLLEAVIPDFFRGARKTWQGIKNSAARNRPITKTKDVLNIESVLKLRKAMHDDYLVYEEAKSKYRMMLTTYRIIG